MLNNMVYYGLAYNLDNMNGNVFLNFFLLGMTEIPSNLIAWWLSLNIGRRWTQSIGFLGTTLTLAIALSAGGR